MNYVKFQKSQVQKKPLTQCLEAKSQRPRKGGNHASKIAFNYFNNTTVWGTGQDCYVQAKKTRRAPFPHGLSYTFLYIQAQRV